MTKRPIKERLKTRILRAVGIDPSILSFSQAGEDRILHHLIGVLGIRPVFYVDMGCNDATIANNTYLFYCEGSCGIVIDPLEKFERQYKKLRPRDKFIRAAVNSTGGAHSQMSIFENSSLNTLCPQTAETYIRLGHKRVRMEDVPTVSLPQILESAQRDVDLLSIDVEGMDLEILRSNDFRKHAPTIICVETVSYETKTQETFKREIHELLSTFDYIEYANSHINTIFVKRNRYSEVVKL